MQLKRFASEAYGAGMHLGPVCESALTMMSGLYPQGHREEVPEEPSGRRVSNWRVHGLRETGLGGGIKQRACSWKDEPSG